MATYFTATASAGSNTPTQLADSDTVDRYVYINGSAIVGFHSGEILWVASSVSSSTYSEFVLPSGEELWAKGPGAGLNINYMVTKPPASLKLCG